MAKETKVISLFDRNKNNYAQLLKDFVKPIEDEFIEDGPEVLYNVAMNAWNMSNMISIIPEELNTGQPTKMLADVPIEVREVVKLLIERKHKLFAKYDLFIFDITINEKSGSIEVQTKPLEEYIVAIEETDDEDDDLFENLFEDGFLDELEDPDGYVDRSALTLIAKRPFWDWLVKSREDIDESDDLFLPSKVILFDLDNEDEIDWLKDNYKKVMKSMLLDYIEEDQLPKRYSLRMFKKWFTFSFVDSVVDFELLDDE